MLALQGSVAFLWLLLFCVAVLGDGGRKLTAAPKKPHLRRRDMSLDPSFHEQVLHYADAPVAGSFAPLAASVTLEPRLPTLILDDIDQHIRALNCVEGGMKIHFDSNLTATAALAAWNKVPELLFITSQQSCGDGRAHSPFIVSRPHLDDAEHAVVLEAKKTTLKSSCHNFFVEMGEHVLAKIDSGELYRRSAMPQPQETSEVATPTSSNNVQIASSSLPVSFEYPTPTAVSDSPEVSKDISFSHVDLALLPPDEGIASLLTSAIPIPDNVVLKCLNCTTSGALSVKAAGFSITTDPDLSDQYDAVTEFFDYGYFQFTASDVFANMSFELAFLPGFTIPIFEARLPDIPLLAIEIQEVLTFGPVLQFLFPISATLNSPVTFQTGFILDVPPNSSIILNVSDITSSSSQGFQDAKLTPLPFNADAENLSFNFSVGFRPKLVLGAALFDDVSSGHSGSNSSSDDGGFDIFHANGGVGTYLDLPQLVATVSMVNNTDYHCEAAASSSSDSDQTYIHIEPFTNFVSGVEWNLDLGAVGMNFERGGGVPLYETSYPLPTQCLQWDSEEKSLVSATSTSSNSSPTSTSTSSPSPSPSPSNVAATSGKVVSRNSWLFPAVLIGVGLVMQ